jgi:hypothetical protein
MKVLLDVQTELSLPGGGCSVETLVRRATELGLHGIAIADRKTLAAAPALVAAGGQAGLEVRVGLRQAMAEVPGLDLLLFPLQGGSWTALAALAELPALTAADLARAGQLAVLAVIDEESASGRPLDPSSPRPKAFDHLGAALRSLKAVLGDRLFLAVPDVVTSGPSSLQVALGRDLDLPCVLAPSVHSVEIEDAPLHRLLVLIRGDHESDGETPRPGRPAALPALTSPGAGIGTLVRAQATVATVPEEHPARSVGIHFFSAILSAQSLLAPPAADPTGDAAALAALETRLLAACAGRRRIPPPGALERELGALARNHALPGITRLLELDRALADRPRLGTSPAWCESWVGFALGWTEAAPSGTGIVPSWIDGDVPLPDVTIEMGEAGARVALGLLELGGAREPLRTRRLTAPEAARWLALSRGFEPRSVRRLVASAEGRSAPGERLPSGSRSLLALAGRLAGKVVKLERAADTRVFSPFTAAHRRLDRLREEATCGGGLGVTIHRDSGLTLLEHAGVGRHGMLREDGSVQPEEILALLTGPLHGRGAAHLAHGLKQSRPRSRFDLGRALVRARRPADAPAARVTLPIGGPAAGPVELLFHEDALAALMRLGLGAEPARELVRGAVEGHATVIGALRSQAERQLAAQGTPSAALDTMLAVLFRLGPELVPGAPWVARAQVLATLSDLAATEPATLAAAVADLSPDRLPALRTWAGVRGIAILPPDLNASGVRSAIERHPAGQRVRLGLRHLAGIDRAAAEVVVRLRGQQPFAGREDVLRRLRHRIPPVALRQLLGEDIAMSAPAAGDLISAPARVSETRPSLTAGVPTGGLLTRGDRMQYDLFARARGQAPRIYTAALARFGVVALERGAAAATDSRIRTVGVIEARNLLVARAGRRLAAARISDQGAALEALLLPEVVDTLPDSPGARPVVVDGRMAEQEGRRVLLVERVVPLELLDQVDLPRVEIQLPAGFRRVRALRLRILKSPGRSPLGVRPPAGDRGLSEWAVLLSRLAVTPDEALLQDLRALVGEGNVHVGGAARLGVALEGAPRPEAASAAGAA